MEGSVYQLLSTVHGTFGSPGNLQIKLLESILLGQPALSSLFLSCFLQQWGKCLGEIRYCHSEFPKWILVTIDLECQNTSPGVSGRLQCFRCKWRLREKQASALKSNYCEEPTQPTVSIHSFSYSGKSAHIQASSRPLHCPSFQSPSPTIEPAWTCLIGTHTL